ncbi:MAG: hypothetical protein K940chlam3_00604 [Chlamydiae bacterium]|nr:hypothetical protein [Chlamydiota bacterium]
MFLIGASPKKRMDHWSKPGESILCVFASLCLCPFALKFHKVSLLEKTTYGTLATIGVYHEIFPW